MNQDNKKYHIFTSSTHSPSGTCDFDIATDFMHRANNKFYKDHISELGHSAIYWTDTILTDPDGRCGYRANRITCGWDEVWTYIQTKDFRWFVEEILDWQLENIPVGTSEKELDIAVQEFLQTTQVENCQIWTVKNIRHMEKKTKVYPMRSTIAKTMYYLNPDADPNHRDSRTFFVTIQNDFYEDE